MSPSEVDRIIRGIDRHAVEPNTFLEDAIKWTVQGVVMAQAGYWSLRLFGLVPW